MTTFQWALKNLGYCPTTYIMLLAIMALLSFPFFCSHKPSKSLMTVTMNRFSSSSCIAPDMEPMAQQSYYNSLVIIITKNANIYRVQVLPTPLTPIHLILQLLCHDLLSVIAI
jgi:hypothetical protein